MHAKIAQPRVDHEIEGCSKNYDENKQQFSSLVKNDFNLYHRNETTNFDEILRKASRFLSDERKSVVLEIMALPSFCSNQEACADRAPVIERWTLSLEPRESKKFSHLEFAVDEGISNKAVKSHLHFSNLNAFFTKSKGKSPIATVCRLKMPCEMSDNDPSTTEQPIHSLGHHLLTEKHTFKPCMLEKSVVLNVHVESAPRSFLLDTVACKCVSDEISLADYRTANLDDRFNVPHRRAYRNTEQKDREEPSTSFSSADEDPLASNSIFFIDEIYRKKSVKSYVVSKHDNKVCTINRLFDNFYLSSYEDGKTGDTGASFAGSSDHKVAASPPIPEPASAVRFFFPEDDDNDDGCSSSGAAAFDFSSDSTTSTITHSHTRALEDFWPSWASCKSAATTPDDEFSLSEDALSPCTPSSPCNFPTSSFNFSTNSFCRRSLVFDETVQRGKARKNQQKCRFNHSKDAEDEEVSSKADKCNIKKQTERCETARETKAGDANKKNFTPSLFGRKASKFIDKTANAVHRFNKRTGLPLSSSPAPMTRNRNSFDFDSSLTAVSAIRRSLQARDYESGASSDSDSGGCVPLCKSMPACTSLLGNFEESALKGRIKPFGTIDGFTLELGASGSFLPAHITIPVTTLFFNISDDNAPSPYFGRGSLETAGKKGYYAPKKGIIQATLFNPQGTVVKMFIVRYDMCDMPPYCQTFVRQRTFFMPSSSNLDDAMRNRSWLRYLIHLRFATSKSGKLFLHTDIRMLFSRKSEMDSYKDCGITTNLTSKQVMMNNLAALETYELRSFTEMPKNPKFSPRKCNAGAEAIVKCR